MVEVVLMQDPAWLFNTVRIAKGEFRPMATKDH
jgi:hypothetical protein